MTPLERAIAATEQELGKVEMVLADPMTLRRIQADRIVRAVLIAVLSDVRTFSLNSDSYGFCGMLDQDNNADCCTETEYVSMRDLKAILADGEEGK